MTRSSRNHSRLPGRHTEPSTSITSGAQSKSLADRPTRSRWSWTRPPARSPRTPSALAKKEVTLDITQPDNGLKLYVNGQIPFASAKMKLLRVGRRYDDGYIVKMDFVLHVPSNVDIKLKTVNEGRVIVRNITGNFIARNVTRNSSRWAWPAPESRTPATWSCQAQLPRKPARKFQLSVGQWQHRPLLRSRPAPADFRFKTFNGGVYSDFPVTTMPLHAPQEERHGGKVVYHADRFTAGRVNAGGPDPQDRKSKWRHSHPRKP